MERARVAGRSEVVALLRSMADEVESGVLTVGDEKVLCADDLIAVVEAPPVESKRRVRLKLVDRQQICLRATEPERLVEEDHPARAIGDLWGRLDLSTADLI